MENKPLPDAPLVEAADTEEALAFVRKLHEEFARERPENAEAFVQKYVDQFSLSRLQSIGRRIMMDLMKPPQSATEAGSAPEESGRRPSPRSRARRGTSGRRSPAREP
jgi:hypothetical protein